MIKLYRRSFIRDNAIVISGHAISYLQGIVLIPIIVKTAGVSVYGGYVLLLSIFNLLYGISSFGSGIMAKRYLPSARNMLERRNLFFPQFFFALASIILISAVFILTNRLIDKIVFKNAVSYSVILVPLYLISYSLYAQGSDYFRYTHRISRMTAANILLPCIFIVLVFCFFYLLNIRNVNSLLLAYTLSAFFIAVLCFRVIVKEIGIHFILFDKDKLISNIRVGFPLVMNFIVDYILSGIDRYFIAFYLSVTAVGCYNPAYVLGTLVILIPKAMGTAIPQLISKAVDSGDYSEARGIVNYSIKIFLLISIPFFFGSIVLAKTILTLFANSEVAESAYLVTPVVAIGTIFYGLNMTLSNVLFVRLKTAAMLRMNLYASMFNILANLIIMYFLRNIVVAAITTFMSYFLVFIYIRGIVVKDWQIDFGVIVIVKSCIASLTMLAVLYGISISMGDAQLIAKLVMEIIAGIAVYIGVLFALRTFSEKEMRLLKRAVL